ncbi:pur operon repressor [Caloramator sp. E03]|uniref:pur operon repressor n=1 Tax=Caloramator sp. E03 TaxID=2576307 RepID=UPI0011107EFF|nr:pur operon repressor [Caloramator sp. E03]QCX33738.1 pur operon repressor [Caloramator sp. E03]
MKRLHRKERVAAILKILTDNPNKVISLGYFSDIFQSARSTLSEDIAIIKGVVENLECGIVETIPGAAGGVKFVPGLSKKEEQQFIEELCSQIKNPSRIIPGGFLYMNDIINSPDIATKIGIIFSQNFRSKDPDYVITVETKGIPIALMTAKALNVPLIIVRRNSKVTEGSTVSINYVSGSSKRIQTMSLSKRSVQKGSKCIFIDDFMKAGGTANGIIELMREFESSVVGIGILIEAFTEGKKLVEDYMSLIKLESVNEETGEIVLTPSGNFKAFK